MVSVVADLERLVVVVDVQRARAANTDLAHLAGDQRGVRADSAAGGEDAFGGDHAAQVFRRSLDAHEENFFTGSRGFDAALGVEVNFARGRAGSGGQAFGDDLGSLDRIAIEDRGEDLVELLGRNAVHRFFPVDQFFLHHVAGDFHRGETGPLAVAGLQHEEFAVLDGELEVLHVREVFLEGLLHLEQLPVSRGEMLLHTDDRLGRAHAGDDVFALRVDEEFAVKDFRSAGRVTGESHAGTARVTHVAEDHALHVDCRAPLVRDAVFAAVNDGALVVPRAENRPDRAR